MWVLPAGRPSNGAVPDEGDSRTDFSNVLTKRQIEEMAMADEYEVVKEVQVGGLCSRVLGELF